MRTIMLIAATIAMIGTTPAMAQDSGDGEGRRAAFREKMQERLMAMDTDGNGQIEKAEFMASAEEKFAKMDGDGDGTVTQTEIEEIRTRVKDAIGGGGFGAQFP